MSEPVWPKLATFQVSICLLCLQGAEGECHSPGCVFFWLPAPDKDQAHALNTYRLMPTCPECAAGKHGNCDQTAWDEFLDTPTNCFCTHPEVA